MPADLPPSEYGGKIQRNNIFPESEGHTLTASDKLHLIYATGQEADSTKDRVPGAFKDEQVVTEE